MQNQLVSEFVFYFKGVSSKSTKMRFGILGIKGYILGKKMPLLRNKGNTPNGETINLAGEKSKKEWKAAGRDKMNLAACGGIFSTGLTRLTRFSYYLYILNILSILSKKWNFLYYQDDTKEVNQNMTNNAEL